MPPSNDEHTEVVALRSEIDDLRRRLSYDELTGLLTRQAFYEICDARACVGDVLAFIDLDDFKSVNDGYGFSKGDELLGKIARAIENHVSSQGVVARLAGDEFLVFFGGGPNTTQAEAICEGLLQTIRQCSVQAKGLDVSRSASIGMARIEKDMAIRDAVILANNGLRIAKENGKNRLTGRTERHLNLSPLRPTIEEVRQGLNRNEIGYYLQPIVDLQSEVVWGYEALLRWRRNDGQILGPAHFLETMTDAYDAKTRPPLEAAHAAADWVTRQQGKLVAFNISTAFLANVTLRGRSWVDEIAGDIPYDKIVFELVETVVSTDEEAISETVKWLRDLGIMIALDDFGVGQSTLSRLQTTPVDFVKIDGRFTRASGKPKRDIAMLERMVDLVHASGAECTIEGIETPDQLARAVNTGARMGQGFFLGKPNPPEYWENADR